MKPSVRLGLLAVALLTLFAAACGDDDGSGTRSGSASASASGSTTGDCKVEGGTSDKLDTKIPVSLKEWSITPETATAKAGVIEFSAKNDGGENHELVVVKASRSDLTVVDGAVDEDALPKGAMIGEIESFAKGKTCGGHFKLDAGNYVLFCNIVEKENGQTVSHYLNGMVTNFTVS
jgi:hypothetical protein